jgi:hypothetical protein
MTNNYLRHPSYAEYPVVGVNWFKQLSLVTGTQRVNEALLKWIFKKNAKTLDVTADANFDTETYLRTLNEE